MYALRLPSLRLDFLSPTVRGPRRRSKMICKSTQLIGEITKIAETADITGITSSRLQIRKRRGISVTLMMQRSDARSIAPQDMIWKSAKLFRNVKRCHHHQHRWPRNPIGANTDGPILPPPTSKWERST
jgi:hypothetical protein